MLSQNNTFISYKDAQRAMHIELCMMNMHLQADAKQAA